MTLKKILFSLIFSVLATLSMQAQNEKEINLINHRGQDLFISGINVAWMDYGNDLTKFNQEKWEQICDELVAVGGNALRWWIHVDGRTTPTYDPDNDLVTGIDETALDNLALAMDIAAAKGVVVSLCLWAHGMMNTDDGDKGTIQAINRVRRNKLLLTDSVATQRYIDNALIPMVEKLKNHTAILCWEIFNEPEGMTKLANWAGFTVPIEMTDIQKFVNKCAGAIHRTDPAAKVSNGNWTILSSANYNGGKNYYSDEELFRVGHDKDGYLDFYMFHYYPSERGSDYSPFHNAYSYFNGYGLDKKTIIGEFPAHGIIKVKGQSFVPRKQLQTDSAMTWLHDMGYSGGFGWTYTGHDGNGGLPDMAAAMTKLKTLYPEQIIVKHDPTFNYIPVVSKKISDTLLFTNSEKIINYINANDYFSDDENDVLSYSIETTGPVTAQIAENGDVSFETIKDSTGCATLTITATDKGDKKVSQSFYILVREKTYDNPNKLYKAYVTCSSVEEPQYMQYYANDGIDTTRWSSQYNDDEFICFDMLQEEKIRRIVLNWEWNAAESKGAYAQAYRIDVSKDGIKWDSVYIVKQGQIKQSNIVLRKDSENPISCRFIKIQFIERATSWGYSLSEVQAYENDNHEQNGTRIKLSARISKYQIASVNKEFKYQIERSYFSDENNDVLTITAEKLPSWASFDPYTFYITGTPTEKDTGSTFIKIKIEDFFGVSNTFDLEIEVKNFNTAVTDIENPLGIYPNPCAKDSFTVTLPNINGKALASFTNADGKLAAIKYVIFTQGRATCSTDGLSKGVYAITIRINNETFKSKVVIE